MISKPAGGNFQVVCLAGSAGGLQAYLDILKVIPADTGMAFVVAPHRGIEHAELLPKILSGVTPMPVLDVEEGMTLSPNTVFIMPPRVDMTLSGETFHLRTTPAPRGWPKSINVFLCSLAEEMGPRAIAAILSGFDHDGSAALKTVKAAGGVTFAQSDASVESMPFNAVLTGHVDYLLTAADIGKALISLSDQPLHAERAPLAAVRPAWRTRRA